MGKSLVIVESPAKARTIEGYLGSGYAVGSSVGHIRDLPNRAKDVPEAQRKRFGALGVDVADGFEPYYVVDPDKKKIIADLKKRLADADELLLATDEDREGEAIAWHLVAVLKPKVPVRRMVFHEITKDAITRALDQTRTIDDRLVDAQETRRILDRLYGYEVSPVLWKKVMPRLSAGRVQSVATRLVVDRERERMRFVAASYWDILGTFEPGAFDARLFALDGKRIAQGRDFGEDGTASSTSVLVLGEQEVRDLATVLQDCQFTVDGVDEKPYTRRPAAPFRTSTLQQEASRKLRFSSQTTMRVAQRLYENGHITYMRTDSVTLSDGALKAARAHAARVYGADTVPAEPRRYERAVANAQEAHEAIRPAGDVFKTPDALRGELSRDEFALYDLIFKRTVASQMKDASGQTVSIELGATTADARRATFRASGTVITFPGFLKAYESGRDEPGDDEDEERRLPALTVGETLRASGLEAQGHETSPPARYTEASLVKALEDRGIGRPSTYASIMGTILDRGYVYKKGTALVPTFVAFSVTQLLERHFDQLVDYDFTARLEDDLDRIAAGDEERVAWLGRFYFGDGAPGLHALVTDHLEGIDAREVNSIPIPASDIVVRVGRYGPYLERGDQRANLPDDLAPDELTASLAEELLARPAGAERELGTHPATGRGIVAKDGRYGPYVTEVLPEGEDGKPRTASLFASMSLDTITLDDAVRLLTLPRTLEGSDGQEILVSNGRYGPFVKRGSETRSLASEEQLLSLTVEQAEELLAQPKQRRGRGAPKPPLKELGADPQSGKPLVVKDGRFGPYVTDGETNASLRRGDTPESITLERAVELLAERRAKSE
ncbi:MAG TPA: type I DNA topoisomerase [Gaiellaceae bacterium]|nr:type I DNA topoisomerase [Gaiellaceae bacterium]